MTVNAISWRTLLINFVLLPLLVEAQTANWRLIWDKNQAADSVAYYIVFRHIGSSPTNSDSIGLSPEPADQNEMTVSYSDNALETGRQYFYRVQAVDYRQRRSALSAPVNESIPKILLPDQMILQISTTSQYDLDGAQFVLWPGYDNSDLQWTISSGTQIQAQINPSDHVLTFQTPADSNVSETFSLSVENPNGFGDSKTITVSLTGGSVPPLPPASEDMVVSVDHKSFGSSIVVINWQTRAETKDYIQYGIDNRFDEISPIDRDYTMSHEITLSELIPETAYQFKIISENPAGIQYTSEIFSFVAGEEANVNVFPVPYNVNSPPPYGGIYFDIPSDVETYTLQIYTAAGDLVYSISDLRQSYIWKIRNNAGREVNAGLYIYRLKGESDNKIASGKLVIIH